MLSRLFEFGKWGKGMKMIFLFFLAIFLSEIIVIFLLNHGGGAVLSKMFTSVIAGIAHTLGHFCKWTYKMVGPVIFPLLTLTAAEIWSVIKLIRCRKARRYGDTPTKHYKVLEIVEGSAPGFGFLGTCIALIFTMHGMDPGLNQAAMLRALLDNSSSAFGSTVYGISLALSAFLAKEMFKGFRITSEADEMRSERAIKQQHEASPINLIRREA